MRSGDTCFRGFIGWTTEVARLPGMESNRMGSKAHGQEGWRAKGDLHNVSGVCRARALGASGDPVEKEWKQGRWTS